MANLKSMKLLILLLAVPFQLAHSAPQPPPKTHELAYPNRIRVRLAEAAPKVQVRGYALSFLENGKARRMIAATASPGDAPVNTLSQWELRCQYGRVRAVPSEGGETLDLVEPVTIRSSNGIVQFRDRPYREELQIHSVGSFCEVINQVDVEKYLSGLVNSEFNSKWSEEAIGAQIVAARTYALYQMMIARGETDRHYDVDATVQDQVYDGSAKEDLQAQRLVERTRGWVLTVGDAARPSPVKAFYHSTCGGMTELPEHVWGNSFAGFRHPVRCSYCGKSPVLNWQLELTTADVIEAFRKALVSSDDPHPEWARNWPHGWQQALAAKRLLDVRVGGLDAEGRVSEVITSWAFTSPETSRQSTLELRIGGARFRDWVGPARFRSASFQILSHARGGWSFQGRGNGHGVGMCQWGAKTMGERGFKTAAILKFYYPDASLRKLW